MDVDSLLGLADSLRRAGDWRVQAATRLDALEAEPQPVPHYVWPSLRERDPAQSPSILLIKAAGAVGKSAAAAALAHHVAWPLINAARAQVGSYSLTGLLHDAFGMQTDFFSKFASGEVGLVIDALDEAHLKAGTSNFIAFLENVESLVEGAAAGGTRVILLSRPDTASLVSAFFEDRNTAYSEAWVDYFGYDQACDFLRSYIAGLREANPAESRYRVVEQNPKGFSNLRDRRFSEIAQAIVGDAVGDVRAAWPSVNTFLGYAPVLAVLAEVLSVNNPVAAQEELLSVHGTSGRSVLADIVDELLRREQGKFNTQVLPKLLANLPAQQDWPSDLDLYSPGEQATRLVARYADVDSVLEAPHGLPDVLRSDYEEAANQFMADHPFLSGGRDPVNAVFGDWIHSKALVDRDVALHLDGSRLQQGLREPGPFLYYFVHQHAERNLDLNVPVIKEDIFSALLESRAKAALGSPTDFLVYIEGDGFGSLTMGNALLQNDPEGLTFLIEGTSGVLELPRHLSRALIRTEGAVMLGLPDQPFTLGPHASILCDELYVEANRLSVDAGRSAGEVVPSTLVAFSDLQIRGALTVDAPTPESFIVKTSAAWPVLRPYMRPLEPKRERDSWAWFMDLRSILTSFRQGAGVAPSIFYEKLEQGIVKDNVARVKILDGLRERGVIYAANQHYYLDTSRLATYDVDLPSIAAGRRSPGVERLLNDLFGTDVG